MDQRLAKPAIDDLTTAAMDLQRAMGRQAVAARDTLSGRDSDIDAATEAVAQVARRACTAVDALASASADLPDAREAERVRDQARQRAQVDLRARLLAGNE